MFRCETFCSVQAFPSDNKYMWYCDTNIKTKTNTESNTRTHNIMQLNCSRSHHRPVTASCHLRYRLGKHSHNMYYDSSPGYSTTEKELYLFYMVCLCLYLQLFTKQLMMWWWVCVVCQVCCYHVYSLTQIARSRF